MSCGVHLAFTVPLLLAGYAACVLFSEGTVEGGSGGNDDNDRSLTVSTAVRSCLTGIDPFLPCINERAMAAIEQSETMDTVRLDSGLEISRQHGDGVLAPREVYSFGKSYLTG